MVTTSPDNLWSPNASDPYNLTTDLAAMQTSVQAALTARKQTYRTDLTDAQRAALPAGDRFEGLRVWTTDTKVLWTYTGDAWVRHLPGQPFAVAAGSFTVPAAIASGSYTDFPVSFPAGRFTVPPLPTFGSGAVRAGVAAESGTTTSGMTVRVFNVTATSTVPAGSIIRWVATQMTPTDAAG